MTSQYLRLFELVLDREPLEAEHEWQEFRTADVQTQVSLLMLLPEFVEANAETVIELLGDKSSNELNALSFSNGKDKR